MFNHVWQTIFLYQGSNIEMYMFLLMHENVVLHTQITYKDGMTSCVGFDIENASKCIYACLIMNLTIKLKLYFTG